MATERRSPGLDPRAAPWLVAAAVVLGALGVLLVALGVGGGGPRPAAPGLPDPGALTGWGIPVAKLTMDLAAVGAVGSLLLGVLAPSRGDDLDPVAARAVRSAAGWAWVWAVAAAGTLALTLSDFLGVPPGQVDYQGTLLGFIAEVSQGRALGVVVVLTVVLAGAARSVRTPNGAALLLILAIAAALPPVLTGHSAGAANHDIATSSLIVHVVAITLWVGGLLGLVVYARSSRAVLRTAVPRFSTVALWCFCAAAASGVVNAWVRIESVEQLVSTSYGRLVLGKVVALVALGAFGWWHRRAILPRLEREDSGAFRRFAAGEVAVMVATVALAVALARTPTPVGEERQAATTAGALIGYDVAPFSLSRVFSEWRIDSLVLTLAAIGLVCYLRGVRRLRAKDIRWPVGRTIAWVSGIAVAVVVLCGGIATYAPVMFSVHMVQHMTLTMLVPILLVMGAPVTLALRALPAHHRSIAKADGGTEGPSGGAGEEEAAIHRAGTATDRGLREWLLVVLHSRVVRVVTFPPVALGLYIVSLYAFYLSPMFVWAMRSHSGHLAMAAHFLLVGGLFFATVIGLDPLPHKLPPLGRMVMLFASLPFHAFFGVIVMTSTTLIGAAWYSSLRLGWVDPLVDQNVGGGIAWGAAELPSLLVLGVIFAQWMRSDTREARRFDRRVDAGTDIELPAYNAWLAQLAAREQRRTKPH
ncbi:cytochrome c oxidase assembly protein [Actinopolymorpha sp. B17G11]|uniref:cytochrome c oxidase assembly protein n=1 Tax=Actinopolymorpha sp. B17G11 TaxID=3160861 RepID=UPI0032E38DD3